MNFKAYKKDLLRPLRLRRSSSSSTKTSPPQGCSPAYKSLLKEKEALEASIKVLSVSHEADVGLSRCAALKASPFLTLWAPMLHSQRGENRITQPGCCHVSITSTKGEFGVEDDRLACGPPPPKLEEASVVREWR